MKEWNPVFTREQIAQAKRNGVSYLTLYARVMYYGWEIDDAINTPTQRRFGNKPKLSEEIVQQAAEHGITRMDIWNRLNSGWTIEEAITKPVKRRKRRRGKVS
jgi:hypothetical protein